MQRMVDSKGALQWSQPNFTKMEFELRGSDELVATLQFRSSFGTFATGESGDGCWTFKRVGFWQQRASVRLCGSETEVASFRNNTWSDGGTLEFAGGRTFKASTNFWSTNLEFKDQNEERLIRFDCGGVFRLSARVEVSPRAAALPELPVLILLGWYLAVMLHQDAGAAGGAGGAAGAAAG